MLPHCQQMKPQRTPEPGSSRARPKNQSLLSLKFAACAHGGCHSICVYTRGNCLREQQNWCNFCTEIAVNARIRFIVVRFKSEGNHNKTDVGQQNVCSDKTMNMTEQVVQQRVHFERSLSLLVRFVDSVLLFHFFYDWMTRETCCTAVRIEFGSPEDMNEPGLALLCLLQYSRHPRW